MKYGLFIHSFVFTVSLLSLALSFSAWVRIEDRKAEFLEKFTRFWLQFEQSLVKGKQQQNRTNDEGHKEEKHVGWWRVQSVLYYVFRFYLLQVWFILKCAGWIWWKLREKATRKRKALNKLKRNATQQEERERKNKKNKKIKTPLIKLKRE